MRRSARVEDGLDSTVTGRLLEGMGEGEDFAVGAGASDELEADREPLGAESGRHGDRPYFLFVADT